MADLTTHKSKITTIDLIKLGLSQNTRGCQCVTFGDLCDVCVGDANVGDPLQVGKGTSLDSCAPQGVGPKL